MTLAAGILALLIPGAPHRPVTPPPIQREFRAAWVATVDNIDWPSKRGLSTAQAQAELLAILDKAREMHLNAIVFQVRTSCDALYESKIEPWSAYLTGEQGKAPNPFWDPLQFAVAEAHKRGLELHAWFNPYRAMHPAQKTPCCASHICRCNPAIVKSYGKYLWLDPGEPETQKYSLSVIMDVVRRYDIDGVHIDDYFYPYKEKDSNKQVIDFPDGPSWSRYVKSGGKLSRGDWRRQNVDQFIERVYNGIKAEKRWVKFGISPFGIYRPNMPEGIKAGLDQYADLYADARKWLELGWCDYFTPQLYWKNSQTPQSYSTLLHWWASQNKMGRNLWPGNFTSKLEKGVGDWAESEILDQITITRGTAGATGNVHFSMKPLLRNEKNLASDLRDGLYREPAMVPASPWLSAGTPAAPTAEFNTGTLSLTAPASAVPLRWWAISVEYGGQWRFELVPATEPSVALPASLNGQALGAIAVRAVDRAGVESEARVLVVSGGAGR